MKSKNPKTIDWRTFNMMDEYLLISIFDIFDMFENEKKMNKKERK